MSRYPGGIITKSPATPTGPTTAGRAPGVWRLDEVAYWVKQGVWPNANIAAPDTYFPYVSLLLSTTSLSNANNNLFVDSSGAFNPVRRFGNATQGSATPYGASWSNFFDGSGDYFTVPYTTANFDWWTSGSDFTIEYWFFANSLTGTSYVDGGTTKSTVVGNRSATTTTDYWSFGPNASGTVTFYYFNGGPVAVNSTSTITANSWNHIAMTKTSSGITIFVNGVAQTTTAISGTPQSSASFPITVGQGNNTSYNGYVSNLRIVRGTAIYSGNFTVPTSPLTAVTNTKLLTCQSNRFRDASTNNLTLTVTGNTSVTEFSPFAPAYPGITYNQSDIQYWSGYFDGSGDFLQTPSNAAFALSTGDYTVECWIYATSTPSDMGIYEGRSTGSATDGFTLTAFSGSVIRIFCGSALISSSGTSYVNQWVHVAVTRASGTTTLWINGVSQGTSATSYNCTNTDAVIGGGRYSGSSSVTTYFPGYISNFRIVKGTAVYTSAFTPSTTPLTAISGTSLLTCQNAAFTDNSTNNFVVTINGNTTVTGNSPFNPVGYWSLYGPSTAGATVPQTTATDLGSGSFTVECWVNLQNYTTDGIVTKRRTDTLLTGSWGIFVTTSGFIRFQGVGWASTYTATTGAIPLNTWTHIAVSRSGTNLSVYVNGVRVINVTDSYDYTCSTYMIIKLGGNSGGNYPSGSALTGGVTGSISNLRIVQGTAVYNPASTTVTVPTSPLTAISGTSFLTLQNGTMKDNSTNNNTSILLYNSAAAIQPFNPFYTSTIASNGGSLYLDGNGDHLAIPISPLFNIGSADASVEMWVYSFNTNNVSLNGQNGGSNSTIRLLQYGGVYAFTINNDTVRSTSISITPNCWVHLVVTITGGIARMFVNGVLQFYGTGFGSVAARSDIYYIGGEEGIADWLTGYISDFRFNNGAIPTAYQTSSTTTGTTVFTPPTSPITPDKNTVLMVNGMNAGAYDATAINDMETVGNAQVSTVQSKFGGSSVYFDGTDDRLFIPTTPQLGFGTGDYTVEFWLYMSALPGTKYTLLDFRTASAAQPHTVYVNSSGYMGFYNGSSDVTSSSQPLSINTWYHVAYSRGSGTLKIFVAGTQAYSAANTIDYQATRPLTIGAGVSGIEVLNGYLDDLRITKGYARYTTTFTPPTQAFPTY